MTQTRREFLHTLKDGLIVTAGAALGGNVLSSCNDSEKKPAEPAKQTPVIHHQGLKKLQASGVQFIAADGTPVDFGQLEKEMGKNNSSLSFMFGGCGTYCPRSIDVINRLSSKDPNMKHIIISASPSTDFSGDPDSGLLRLTLNQYGVDYENSIILFPTLTGKKQDLELQQDILKQRKDLAEKVKAAQISVNMLPLNDSGASINHSGKIKLYDPKGEFVVESLEPDADKMAEELLNKLVPAPSRGDIQR